MADVVLTQGKKVEDGKRFLTKEDILSKNDVTFLEMEVPQWGGTIRFRSLTGDEAIDFGKRLDDMDAKQEAVIDLFAISAVDDNGDRLFEPRDIRQLRKKSWAVYLKAQNKLLEFNGYTDKSKVAAKNG